MKPILRQPRLLGKETRYINQSVQDKSPAGVKYASRDVLIDPELREEIKKFSQWPTIPQVIQPLILSVSCLFRLSILSLLPSLS